MTARRLPALGLVSFFAFAACGGTPSQSESGLAASAAGVGVTGRIAERGTRGSILVFAYTELGPNENPVGHEPASVGTLAADGGFDVGVPAGASLTLVFLADNSNDGVVDEGDPIAVFTSLDLADLHAGDRVHVADAALDFSSRRVTATLEVARANEPARTPTPMP